MPCASASFAASTASNAPAAPIATIKAPPAFSTARRENAWREKVGDCPFWSWQPPSTHHRRGALDRAQNADMWVPQRHLSPESAARISPSVGFFLSRRKAAAVMIQPLIQ